jgi:protein-histidine pros-kinase
LQQCCCSPFLTADLAAGGTPDIPWRPQLNSKAACFCAAVQQCDRRVGVISSGVFKSARTDVNLRFKFNLVLIGIFALGSAAVLFVSRQQFLHDAEDEVTRQSALIMESALAVRGYTTARIKPHLDPKLVDVFLPETVPAFAATETINLLRKKYPDYGYKEAALNPTNPRDLAHEWEAAIIRRFREDPASTEAVGERFGQNGQQWYVARPIRITNPQCLNCHSTPTAAPASLIRAYGGQNGFGWNLNEVIGAQIVTVPMAVPMAQADAAFRTFVLSIAAVLVLTLVALNVMLSRLIIRPVTAIAKAAEAISLGRTDVAEFSEKGGDEVAELRRSFNRMRRSLVVAMSMIGKR